MSEKKSRKEGNLYDKIFKENLEELVLPMLRQYWKWGEPIDSRPVEIKSVHPIRIKLQTTTQREADFLSEITDSQDRKFILHVEFQTKDDKEMLYRMQEYHGIISRKFQLPIRHYVIYFGSSPSKMAARLPQTARFDGFTLLDFQTLDYRDLLLSETGSEIVLAILADFKGKPAEAVIRLILQRLKAVSKSEAELKKYFSQLNVLSRLRNLNEQTVKSINAMPITIDIKKDYLYKKGLEEGNTEKTRKATINMLTRGYEVSAICEVLEVSEAYVLSIKKELGL